MYASILKFLHSLTHSGSLSGSLSHILAHSGPLSGFLRRSLAHKVLARPTTSWLRGHSLSLTIRVLYCAGVGLFCVSHRFRNLASNFALGVLGAVHFVLDRGEGSSRFITILHVLVFWLSKLFLFSHLADVASFPVLVALAVLRAAPSAGWWGEMLENQQ